MPTYEYQCSACGHQFEKFQSITAEPIKVCPECNKKKVKRLIGTGAGLIFKGSGFYITDYRSDGYKSAAKSESGSTAKSSGDTKSTGGDAKSSAGATSSNQSSTSSTAKNGSAAPAASSTTKSA